ncbi:unnamed protein product, partial [Chrysoparadoxa australica]
QALRSELQGSSSAHGSEGRSLPEPVSWGDEGVLLPDLRQCLAYQKLQMLDLCIRQLREEAGDDNDGADTEQEPSTEKEAQPDVSGKPETGPDGMSESQGLNHTVTVKG